MLHIMGHILRRARAPFATFGRAQGGNVAMMFAIALVPIVMLVMGGLDYARAMLERAQMSDAADAAALAVGSTKGLTTAQAAALAQQFFNANYKGPAGADGKTPQVSVSYDSTKGTVTLTVNYQMPTTVLGVFGQSALALQTTSTVVWGQSKLWVALVLDNSGSMASSGKMNALITSSQQLLVTLQNASTNPGDVQVGIVPFVSVINVGKTNSGASWLSWTDWDAAPVINKATIADGYVVPKTNIPFDAYGPGDDCPFTTTKSSSGWGGTTYTITPDSPFSYRCEKSASNGSGDVAGTTNSSGAVVAPIPASGSQGLICPGPGLTSGGTALNNNNDHISRYFNGCWTASKLTGQTVTVSSGSSATCGGFSSTNCTCSGKNSSKICKTQKWQHAWTSNAHSSWSGCAMDRAQDYDIQNTQPSGASTGLPAANPTGACLNATVTPLGYNWSSLNTQIGNMQANGSTNQAVGVVNGWQMLTPGAPWNTPAVPGNTSRYIILLSDGLNTQDRWWGDGMQENTADDQNIDARETKACAAAKADGVIIYALYVNINGSDGNSAPLQACASDSSKYFVLTSSSQIATAFATIGQQITSVRVAK